MLRELPTCTYISYLNKLQLSVTKRVPETSAVDGQSVGVHHSAAVETPGVGVVRRVGVAVSLTEPCREPSVK